MQSKALNVALALILLYGVVPYIYVNILSNGNSEIMDYTVQGMIYSVLAVLLLFFLRKVRIIPAVGDIKFNFWLSKEEAQFAYGAVFVLSAVSFLVAPWHAAREGLLSSISAFCRVIWIIVAIPLLDTRKAKIVLFLSIILMFLDGSRTFIFIIFIYYFLHNRIPKYLLIIGVFSVLLVASFRNGFYSFDLLYGIFGEGVNGSSGLFQAMQVKQGSADWPAIWHLTYTFFQPFLIVFTIFLPKAFLNANIDSSQFLGAVVDQTLNQQYYPMGGFYVLSEFVPYGYLGVVLFCIYFFLSFRLSAFLLNSRFIVFAPTLLFMLIKSSPFTYWKWVIWFLIIQIVFKIIIMNLTAKNEK